MRIGFLLFCGLIRRRPLRLVLIALCSFGCFLCYLGLGCSRDTIAAAQASFVETTGLGDIVVATEEVPEGELRDMLLHIDGVSSADEGYRYSLRCAFGDGAVRTARFFGYAEESIVSPIMQGEGDFALSYGYAADFSAEQAASLTLPDGEVVPVDAVAYLPLYTAVYIDRHTPSADGEIVDLYADVETIWNISGDRLVNYAVAELSEGADIDAVLRRIAENDVLFVEYALPAAEETAYAASAELGDVILSVCRLFPWILFAVGLLFICIFLSGLADRSRATAAVLLSDGASLSDVFYGLCLYGLFAVLLGFFAALPAGLLLARSVTDISLENMGLPGAALSFPLSYLLTGLAACAVLALLASAAGTVFLCRRSLVGLLRRVRRRKTGVVMDVLLTALCTAAAICLVTTTLFYKDSLTAVREDLFSHRYSYDAQVVYSGFVPLTRLEELERSGTVAQCEPLLLGTATLSCNGKTCDVSGMALAEGGSLISFYDADGRRMSAVGNQIVLSEWTALRLGAKTGDLVRAEVVYGGKRLEASCLVAGVSEQYSSFTELISIGTIEEYLDSSGVMNSAAVRLLPGKTEEFLRYAESLDGVYSVQLKENAAARFDDRFSGTKRLIDLIIADGALLGFSIYLLMGYSAWRRNLKRNSILLMLGESPLRLAAADALVRLCGVALGLCLGIPASLAAARGILLFLSSDAIRYPFVLRPESLLTAVALALSYVAAVAVLYCIATAKRARDII